MFGLGPIEPDGGEGWALIGGGRGDEEGDGPMCGRDGHERRWSCNADLADRQTPHEQN